MPSVPTVPDDTDLSENQSSASRWKERLLRPDRFHFKLLLGTGAGVLVIVVLAITCVVATLRSQHLEKSRAHTIDVMRLSSVAENDLAGLENAFRGHLLTHDEVYAGNFKRFEESFRKHSDELTKILGENTRQRKRVLDLRKIVQTWLQNTALSIQQPGTLTAESTKDALSAPALTQARGLLQEIERDEQMDLNHRVRDQEWAIQSTQILNFIPKLERAAADMQKEKRAFLLTGDPAFIDAYKAAMSDFYAYHGYLSVLIGNEPAELQLLATIRECLEKWVARHAAPDIEAKRAGQDMSDPKYTRESEALMNNVRRSMEQFEKAEIEIYRVRLAAAARERVLTTAGIDALCALAAALMLASSSYSFILSRRQLKKLASADARIRSVVEHMLDGLITTDEKGAIHSMNPAAQRMFGYQGEQYLGDKLTQLLPKYFERETDRAPIECAWAQFVQRIGGTTSALGLRRDGTIFPVEISLTTMEVEQQTFYSAMVRDITAQKRFEEELAAEKESLAVTLASIGDGVITTDLNGKVVVCNAASEAMTGWERSAAVGQPLRTVFNIATSPATKRRQPAGAGFRSEAEAILLATPEQATLASRDGTEREIEQVASPIKNGKNEICGVVLVFRDITKRLRDEAERRKSEALDQLGLLAGGIAHDFNNLLTAVIGNISLASVVLPPGDPLINRLEDAKNASFRARDLAQQLLTFARGGAPIKQTASIADLIQETVSFSLRGSQSRSEIEIEPELWSAEFDPGQISQVVANLVVNADQAMPDGGTLHINCENFSHGAGTNAAVADLRPGDYIRIQIRDEGIGIPQEFLKQIFDPYFTTKPKGNGLGLATTYSVIKNHDGLITVDSQQFCGSTFTIYLPAARQPQVAAVEPAAPAKEPMTRGSGRILVVDDEEAIRMLVEFTLARLGYEVVTAENSLRGIELYRTALEEGTRFDLVILDLTLPGGMGGKDALKRLLEIDPMVSAVVSSGYAMDATMSRYEDFGFRGVIAKPYEASELGRKVHAVIEESRRLHPASAYELQHVS